MAEKESASGLKRQSHPDTVSQRRRSAMAMNAKRSEDSLAGVNARIIWAVATTLGRNAKRRTPERQQSMADAVTRFKRLAKDEPEVFFIRCMTSPRLVVAIGMKAEEHERMMEMIYDAS